MNARQNENTYCSMEQYISTLTTIYMYNIYIHMFLCLCNIKINTTTTEFQWISCQHQWIAGAYIDQAGEGLVSMRFHHDN